MHAWPLAAQDSPSQAVRAERRISEESRPREHPRGTAFALYSAIHNAYCTMINRLQPRLYPGGPVELRSIQQKSLRLHSHLGRPGPKDSVNSLPSSRSSVIDCCEDRSRCAGSRFERAQHGRLQRWVFSCGLRDPVKIKQSPGRQTKIHACVASRCRAGRKGFVRPGMEATENTMAVDQCGDSERV